MNQCTPGLSILHKLHYEHVYLTSYSKMRVDLAVQVLNIEALIENTYHIFSNKRLGVYSGQGAYFRTCSINFTWWMWQLGVFIQRRCLFENIQYIPLEMVAMVTCILLFTNTVLLHKLATESEKLCFDGVA